MLRHHSSIAIFGLTVYLSLVSSLVSLKTTAALDSETDLATPKVVVPSAVTAYDVVTHRELYYRRHVLPFIAGGAVDRWPLWRDLTDSVGSWISPFVDATRISATIVDSFPVGEQEAARKITQLVAECARILNMENPDVFIRRSPHARAYVTEVAGRPMLTLTSGLLDLYRTPEELRFVIGRELGRIKSGHVSERAKAYAVFAALHRVNLVVVPDKAQFAITGLVLGRLMSLYREMEFTADRAGLLCCQDLGTAQQAMLRDLHGLPIDSPWLEDIKFDPQAYLKTMEYWERKTLVSFIQDARRYCSSTPFVRDRVAQLTDWAHNGSYKSILGRIDGSSAPDPDQLVTIKTVEIQDIADADSPLNPYVRVYFGDTTSSFQTTVVRSAQSARWTNIGKTHSVLDNQPIFFEIWNSRWGRDAFVGGFVIFPVNPTPTVKNEQVFRAPLEWDWKERTTTSRHGVGKVVVEFFTRAK